MKIAVLGLGYVGMTAAACLASQGHEVIGIDPSETKVRTVNSGLSPITEPGLDELVSDAVAQKLLTATTHLTDSAATSQLAIVCVGTPSSVDGSHDLTYIVEVSRQLADLMARSGAQMTIAYRSTIRPGTIEDLIEPIFQAALGADSDQVELVYNPEFLRESTAIADYFSPPKIVIGTRDGLGCATMDEIHQAIDAPVFNVRYRESEVTKFVDNTFHAVKIAFANEIGRICVNTGVDPREVHRIFVSDTKLNISPYYLRPGGAFGGSCLPKDVRALQHISRSVNGVTHLIDSLLTSNEAHKQFLFELATRDLDFGAKVLLVGLAFKDRSDDLRESPNIDLARMLITAGYQVSVYDPYVKPDSIVGQNLGALSKSPFIRKVLVDADGVAAQAWDLVVTARELAPDLQIGDTRVVDLTTLAP